MKIQSLLLRKEKNILFFQVRTRSLWGCYFFSVYNCKEDPPPSFSKKMKFRGGAFTINHHWYGWDSNHQMGGLWHCYSHIRNQTIMSPDLPSSPRKWRSPWSARCCVTRPRHLCCFFARNQTRSKMRVKFFCKVGSSLVSFFLLVSKWGYVKQN